MIATRPDAAQAQDLQLWPRWPVGVIVLVVAVVTLLATGARYILAGESPQPAPARTQKVTLPEGVQVFDALRRIANATDIPLEDLQATANRPERLGLPHYAQGQLEGFLLPGTYDIVPGSSAEWVVKQMVDRFEEAARDLGLTRGSHALGRSPLEIVTTASLVEQVAVSDVERPRVARVIYNRLAARMPLQLDSTVEYVRRQKQAQPSDDELRVESSYSTYRNLGLPPTPIGSPGLESMKAALLPATGNYRYFLTADEVGGPLFTDSVHKYLQARDIKSGEAGAVTDVLDGDSILVRIGERTEDVRLIGVDTPEHGECYFAQSRAATTKLLRGKRVTLHFDEDHDRSDGTRLFAYVYVDGKLINRELIRQGFARERAYGDDYELRSDFRAAARKPWQLGSGLWGQCS